MRCTIRREGHCRGRWGGHWDKGFDAYGINDGKYEKECLHRVNLVCCRYREERIVRNILIGSSDVGFGSFAACCSNTIQPIFHVSKRKIMSPVVCMRSSIMQVRECTVLCVKRCCCCCCWLGTQTTSLPRGISNEIVAAAGGPLAPPICDQKK